jgi:hypothetical protein
MKGRRGNVQEGVNMEDGGMGGAESRVLGVARDSGGSEEWRAENQTEELMASGAGWSCFYVSVCWIVISIWHMHLWAKCSGA